MSKKSMNLDPKKGGETGVKMSTFANIKPLNICKSEDDESSNLSSDFSSSKSSK